MVFGSSMVSLLLSLCTGRIAAHFCDSAGLNGATIRHCLPISAGHLSCDSRQLLIIYLVNWIDGIRNDGRIRPTLPRRLRRIVGIYCLGWYCLLLVFLVAREVTVLVRVIFILDDAQAAGAHERGVPPTNQPQLLLKIILQK